MNDQETKNLTEAVTEILSQYDDLFGVCVPFSCMLAMNLDKKYNMHTTAVTGDLLFQEHIIFQQKNDLNNIKGNFNGEWDGHCWIELQDYLVDITISRTVQSPRFTKPYKNELSNAMMIKGNMRPIIGPKRMLEIHSPLKYVKKSELSKNLIETIANHFILSKKSQNN